MPLASVYRESFNLESLERMVFFAILFRKKRKVFNQMQTKRNFIFSKHFLDFLKYSYQAFLSWFKWSEMSEWDLIQHLFHRVFNQVIRSKYFGLRRYVFWGICYHLDRTLLDEINIQLLHISALSVNQMIRIEKLTS